MKTYTIIAGLNGAGKSSLTGVLAAHTTDLGVIVDVDKLAAQFGGNIAGGKQAIAKIDSCLEKGVSFTQETTLSGVRTAKTAKRAKEQGYYIRLYYVGLSSVEESLKRIQNRVAKGGHDIPANDVLRRYEGRIDALARVLPYCDEAAFFDNENGFVEVAEYRNGHIIIKGTPRPAWIYEIATAINNA